MRIWSKVSFGKSALKDTLLDKNINYADVQMFLFAHSKKQKFIAHMQTNRDEKRKPERIKRLYENDIDNFNRWILKILIKKSKQPATKMIAILPDKYETTVIALFKYSFVEQKEMLQNLACHDLREATLVLLCLAKKDYSLFTRILKEWDSQYITQKRGIIKMIRA